MVDKNPQKIKSIFNEISNYYDFMNNVISFGLHYFIKTLAIKDLKLKDNSRVLDLATGSGDIAKIISKTYPHTDVTGLDVSDKMLEIARNKYPNLKFVEDDITNLGFKDSEFDCVTISFGLRNIENRQKALFQIYRILKKDGLFFHLDFGKHNIFNKFFNCFALFAVKLFKIKNESYEYLIESKNDYPEPDELIKEFENTGFEFVSKKYFLFKTISYQIMKK